MDSQTQAFTSQQAREIRENAAQRHKAQLQVESLTTATSPDFLRFIPCNAEAKLAFSEIIDRKKANMLGEHHAQYLVDNGRGPLRKNIIQQARSEGETTDEEYSEELEAPDINLGYFRVNFDCPSLTRGTKWVIGRGSEKKKAVNKVNRNVDILLAVPGSKYSKGLLAAHAYLRMHPESGIWMICAAPESRDRSGDPSSGATVKLEDNLIFDKEFRCLDKPEARLVILNMEFSVQFALNTFEATQKYRESRNTALRAQDIAVPDTYISGIPLKYDIRAADLAVFSTGLASGTHATVYEAFDPQSGELRVVKVIEVKREAAARLLQPEVQMATQFGNARGLIRQYGWCNSNGDRILNVELFPMKLYLVQEKGKGFHKHDWRKVIGHEELKLCQDLLHGLVAIHAEGWMHRDISQQNILYFEGNPARATLCDFGKLHPDKTDTYTALAAWDYLPPEIVQGRSNRYNQSIDIWMLALALVLVWYPDALQGVPRLNNRQIRVAGLKLVRDRLHRVKDSGLAGLLNEMLAENAESRPTASQALGYLCFRNLNEQAAKMAKLAEGERRRPDDDAGDGLHTRASQEL